MNNIYSIFKCMNSLFEKKKFGEENFSAEELSMTKRLSKAKLLRALVDPFCSFEVEEGYVPDKLELELSYFAVSGRPPSADTPIKELVRVAFTGLECAKDMRRLLPVEMDKTRLEEVELGY